MHGMTISYLWLFCVKKYSKGIVIFMNNQSCANCGKPIDANTHFCEGCGIQVMQQPLQYQPPQQPSQYQPQQPLQYPPQQPSPYPPQYSSQQYNYPHQVAEEAPGRKFLFVVGILYIVFGALGILGALISSMLLLSPNEWLWMYGGEAMLGAWHFYYIAPIFTYAFVLIVGIISVMNSKNREKANLIQGLGIACISVTIAFYAIATVLGVFTYLGVLGAAALILLPLEFVLPILLIIGARKNMRNI